MLEVRHATRLDDGVGGSGLIRILARTGRAGHPESSVAHPRERPRQAMRTSLRPEYTRRVISRSVRAAPWTIVDSCAARITGGDVISVTPGRAS